MYCLSFLPSEDKTTKASDDRDFIFHWPNCKHQVTIVQKKQQQKNKETQKTNKNKNTNNIYYKYIFITASDYHIRISK